MPAKEKKKKSKPLNSGLRFANLAFEVVAILLIGVWGGIELDKELNTSPLFLLLFMFMALFGAGYLFYKNLPKD